MFSLSKKLISEIHFQVQRGAPKEQKEIPVFLM